MTRRNLFTLGFAGLVSLVLPRAKAGVRIAEPAPTVSMQKILGCGGDLPDLYTLRQVKYWIDVEHSFDRDQYFVTVMLALWIREEELYVRKKLGWTFNPPHRHPEQNMKAAFIKMHSEAEHFIALNNSHAKPDWVKLESTFRDAYLTAHEKQFNGR